MGFNSITQIHWHPYSPNHLAILDNKQKFLLYDNNDIDTPELQLNLNEMLEPISRSKRRLYFPSMESEESTFEDFQFGEENQRNDFSEMSVYFLSSQGDIFCYSPLIFSGFRIETIKLIQLETAYESN